MCSWSAVPMLLDVRFDLGAERCSAASLLPFAMSAQASRGKAAKHMCKPKAASRNWPSGVENFCHIRQLEIGFVGDSFDGIERQLAGARNRATAAASISTRWRSSSCDRRCFSMRACGCGHGDDDLRRSVVSVLL
jgi:hypothetical protein